MSDNFSYSINRKLNIKEKQIVKKGFPRKKRKANNKDNVIDESILCFNS